MGARRAVGTKKRTHHFNPLMITTMDPADNDYWDWREQNERDVQAQVDEQQMYEAMADMNAMQAAIEQALAQPLAALRAQRTTEVL